MSQQLTPAVDWTSDPNFVLVDGVPILDEHELHLPPSQDGKAAQTLRIDAAKLHMIAGNNNRRVRDTGDTPMLTVGHTSDDPEKDDPEIVGEADSFRVAPLFNTGRQAIFARFKFRKSPDVIERLKKGAFGRRSVELWTDRWEIDPIALLGATAPERDLGVLRLHRMSGKRTLKGGRLTYEVCRVTVPVRYGCHQYDASAAMLPTTTPNGQMPPAALPPQPGQPGTTQPPAAPLVDPQMMQGVLTGLQSSDMWQQLQAQLAQLAQMQPMIQQLMQMLGPLMGGGMGPAPGMGQPMPGQPGEPGMGGQMPGADPIMQMLMQMQGGGTPGMEGDQQGPNGSDQQRDEDDRVRMQSTAPGFSTPTATNPFIPGWTGDRRTQNPPRHSVMQTYQHNGATTQTVPPQQVPQLPQQPVVPQQPIPETPQQTIVRLQRQVHELQQQVQQQQVVMELQQLMAEGVELNPQEEFPFLVQMDQPLRMQRYQIMRQRYAKRTQNLQPLMPQVPQMPQQPMVPNPAVGQQSVLHRYHDQQAAQPVQAAQEPPLSPQEREAVYQELCAMRDKGTQVNDAVVREVTRAVRYGRRYRGGVEPTY